MAHIASEQCAYSVPIEIPDVIPDRASDQGADQVAHAHGQLRGVLPAPPRRGDRHWGLPDGTRLTRIGGVLEARSPVDATLLWSRIFSPDLSVIPLPNGELFAASLDSGDLHRLDPADGATLSTVTVPLFAQGVARSSDRRYTAAWRGPYFALHDAQDETISTRSGCPDQLHAWVRRESPSIMPPSADG